MRQLILKVHPDDNVLVALSDLKAGETVTYQDKAYTLLQNVNAKA